MLKTALKTFVGSRHKREAKKLQPLVDEINSFYGGLSALSDEELKSKTVEFRGYIAERTAQLKAEISERREEKRDSEDPSERERLSLQIGGLEQNLHDELEECLEDLLPEAFAVVKDACRRLVGTEVKVTGQMLKWDMIPYDVQLIGAIALHRGKVAEMATGEGKDFGRDDAALLERTCGPRFSLGDGQLLSRSARFRVDGASVRLSGSYRRRDRPS